ncbi:MAG: hypothetical protein WBG43_07045 [Marinifilaceae bacterium]
MDIFNSGNRYGKTLLLRGITAGLYGKEDDVDLLRAYSINKNSL